MKWRMCQPFVVPGKGFWFDAHRIERLRCSTYEDFAVAIPKPMPVYIRGNPFCHTENSVQFKRQEIGYHLCRRVAVSVDGKIYRATDAEIAAALKSNEEAPSCSAATYVKAVQEVRRRHALTTDG
ncbi:unnamed protein product [Laminaria digitata]